MMVRQRPSPADEGFTLVELLVAMGLFGLVTTLLLGFALSTSDVSRKAQEMAEVDEGARLAMERMARELREASTITAVAGSSVTFRTALNCGEVIATSTYPTSGELLSYSLEGHRLEVTSRRDTYDGETDTWTPVLPEAESTNAIGTLVDNVEAFEVTLVKDGAAAALGTADTVVLSLTVTDADDQFARTFDTRVTLRNEAARCWIPE